MGIETNSEAIKNSRLDLCVFTKNLFISKNIFIPFILKKFQKQTNEIWD
ncbi:MAG: hypothetical protein LBS61_01965 [Endomicrobium sp.]|jgi:hypothetical protein|nr:hypothetical protein [Endomicrobium sp.]